MEKSDITKTGINQLVDIRTIGTEGKNISLTATEDDKKMLAERFGLPAVHDLSVNGRLFWENDDVVFDGVIHTDLDQICVVSLEPFRREYTYPCRVLFSEDADNDASSFDAEADVVEVIERGKINLGSVIAEEFGVHLEDFPKKEEAYFDYREDDSEIDSEDNPFAALKNLTFSK